MTALVRFEGNLTAEAKHVNHMCGPSCGRKLITPSRGAAVGRNLVSWTNVGRPTDDWEKAKTNRKVQSRRPVKFIGTGSGGTFSKHFTD
ncbi:MAG: hypothetical protein ACTS46_01925 [Candidatus Hodgkinia cicadicola]